MYRDTGVETAQGSQDTDLKVKRCHPLQAGILSCARVCVWKQKDFGVSFFSILISGLYLFGIFLQCKIKLNAYIDNLHIQKYRNVTQMGQSYCANCVSLYYS